jgi:SAM-dependent methyltransferase
MTSYVMDNAWQGERQRLAVLEADYDPGTIRHLEARGVGEGWRCWEVGAGGGSITEWLCERVGPTGRVLATDLDTRFVGVLAHPNLEVRTHNVVTDPLPEGPFDLVHTRLLLTHLPEREDLVQRLAGVLAPGGWLVLEEFDLISAAFDPRIGPERLALLTKVQQAFFAYMASQRGPTGNECGRRLYGWLLDAGLEAVGAEGRVAMIRGSRDGGGGAPLRHPQVRAAVVARGGVTDADIEGFLTLLRDPNVLLMSNILMTAWGRRPTEGVEGQEQVHTS